MQFADMKKSSIAYKLFQSTIIVRRGRSRLVSVSTSIQVILQDIDNHVNLNGLVSLPGAQAALRIKISQIDFDVGSTSRYTGKFQCSGGTWQRSHRVGSHWSTSGRSISTIRNTHGPQLWIL